MPILIARAGPGRRRRPAASCASPAGAPGAPPVNASATPCVIAHQRRRRPSACGTGAWKVIARSGAVVVQRRRAPAAPRCAGRARAGPARHPGRLAAQLAPRRRCATGRGRRAGTTSPPAAHPLARAAAASASPAGQRQDLHAERARGRRRTRRRAAPARSRSATVISGIAGRRTPRRRPSPSCPCAAAATTTPRPCGVRRRAGGARRRSGCGVRRRRPATRAAGTTRTSSAGRSAPPRGSARRARARRRSGRTRRRLARSRCTPVPSRR